MAKPLKLLIVEDSPDDSDLLVAELRRGGFDPKWERVETEEAFLAELKKLPDIVLCDYSMPQFSGLRAAQLAQESGLGIPFILVSGTVGEEAAVEAMKCGATDYLLKDRIARLGSAVEHVLEQKRLRSERKAADRQIRLQAGALEAAANAILITDTQGKILSANTAFCTMTGYTPEELLGRNPGILKSGEHSPDFYMTLWQTILSGEVWRGEMTNRRKDGAIYHEEMTITPVRADGGEITHFIAVKQDITERMRAEEVMRKVSQQEVVRTNTRMIRELAIVIGIAILGFFVFVLTDVLQAPLNVILKYTDLLDEVVGTLLVLVTGLAVLAYRRWKETKSQINQQRLVEQSLRTLHGELEARVQLRTVELARMNEALRAKIAEHTRAEEVLRESERRFRELLENLGLIAMTLDRHGKVTFCNDYLLRTTGWLREEILGADWFEKFIPDTRAEVRKVFFETIEAGQLPAHHENPIKTRQGELREIVWNNTMLRDAAGNIIGTASIGEDVTERKRAEEALRASELKFRQLAENINEVFWLTDPAKNQMLYISPAYEKIWGRACESLYESPRTWLDAIHPADRERVLEAATTKQNKGEYDETYRIVRPDGSLRWIHDRAFPIRNADGEVYRVVGTAEDITERNKLEAQFLRAQRMESIGTLAGGIAHDLNNVLTPILMSCELMRMETRDEDTRHLLGMIKGSAQRGAELVKQVLSFARGVEGQRISLQPKHLISEMVNIARETFPKSINIQSLLPKSLWMLSGDPTQLHQVLLNLCVNARDAMPAGGELTIAAENVLVETRLPGMDEGAKPGPHIVIKVTDTGAGIPPELREKIFDPFFTTKEVGKGTGLGLSTSLGIVKSHGGFIKVESEPGKGSTFEVWLPAKTGEEQSPSPVEEARLPRGNGELILVVDDEASLRAMTRQTLEAYGYVVLTATNGVEAAAIYSRYRDGIEAVLTDMAMPVMDGAALTLALRRINPAVRVIAASGLSNPEHQTKAIGAGAKQFLSKPYNAEMLLNSLAEILHDRRSSPSPPISAANAPG